MAHFIIYYEKAVYQEWGQSSGIDQKHLSIPIQGSNYIDCLTDVSSTRVTLLPSMRTQAWYQSSLIDRKPCFMSRSKRRAFHSKVTMTLTFNLKSIWGYLHATTKLPYMTLPMDTDQKLPYYAGSTHSTYVKRKQYKRKLRLMKNIVYHPMKPNRQIVFIEES